SEAWRYPRPMVPGSDPLTNLARVVRPAGEEDPGWVARQAAGFREDPGHLARLVAAGGQAPLVLAVDQVEGGLTLCGDEGGRQGSANNLVCLVQEPGASHMVVLTLRSDFEPQVARLRALMDLLQEKPNVRVTPTPLSARDLQRAIEEPARQVGLRFEDGL